MAQLNDTTINGNLVITGSVTASSITGSISNAIKATGDEDGDNIKATYANRITLENSKLYLKNKNGAVLSSAEISTADTLDAICANGADTSSSIYVSNSSPSTSPSTGALRVLGGIGVQGDIWGGNVFNANWNSDYAEKRLFKGFRPMPGKVCIENGDETISYSTDRLQAGGKIISDTYGSLLNSLLPGGIPIALSGRVLAYLDRDYPEFSSILNMAVGTGKDGNLSIMTREEIREYPERVVGIIIAIPKYKEWHGIEVNGRVWIQVK
jgi:hypothetical protein